MRQTTNLGKYHYEAVAEAFRAEYECAERTCLGKDGEAYRAHRYALQCLAQRLADIYAGTGRPFDRQQFTDACRRGFEWGTVTDVVPVPEPEPEPEPEGNEPGSGEHCIHCPRSCKGCPGGYSDDCGHCIDGCC